MGKSIKIGYLLQFAIDLYDIVCYMAIFLLIMLIYDNFLGHLIPDIILYFLVAFFFIRKFIKHRKTTLINSLLIVLLAFPVWCIITDNAIPVIVFIACVVNCFLHLTGILAVSEWLIDEPVLKFPLETEKMVKIPAYMQSFLNVTENERKFRYLQCMYICSTRERIISCLIGDLKRLILPYLSLYLTSFMFDNIGYMAYFICFILNLIIYCELCCSVV